MRSPPFSGIGPRGSTEPASHAPDRIPLTPSGRLLAHDVGRLLVGPPAEVHGVAQAVVPGPLAEAHLHHETGLDPRRVPLLVPGGGRIERAGVAARAGEESLEGGDLAVRQAAAHP